MQIILFNFIERKFPDAISTDHIQSYELCD